MSSFDRGDYKDRNKYSRSIRAKVISNALSPTKHDIDQIIYIIDCCEDKPHLLVTLNGGLVDYREVILHYKESN